MNKRTHALYRLSIICLGLPLIVSGTVVLLSLLFFYYTH